MFIRRYSKRSNFQHRVVILKLEVLLIISCLLNDDVTYARDRQEIGEIHSQDHTWPHTWPHTSDPGDITFERFYVMSDVS